MDWIEQRDSGGWLAEAVSYFRAFGFFESERHQPDEAVIARVRAYYQHDWDDYMGTAPDRPSADQFLLIADTSRVWFGDLERVYHGAEAYAGSLREWAAISREVFTPVQIAETWHADEGPVEVTFVFGGARHTFVHRDGHDDFIDLEIIHMINGLLTDTPYRFEACDNLGDCRFIVVLDCSEKARLKQERAWSFCDFLASES